MAPDGTVSTLAGSGEYGSADGPDQTAQFRNPYDVAVARDGGSVFVADYNNHAVRAVALAGSPAAAAADTTVSTVAGLATNAGLDNPCAVAALPDGGCLVCDTGNCRLVTVPAAGEGGGVTLIAGSGFGASTDGVGAATATFSFFLRCCSS